MSLQVQAYLSFEGRCEEALDFYARALGAQRGTVMRYRDMPASEDAESWCHGNTPPPGDKIMHAEFTVGGTQLMASDGMLSGQPRFEGISLALTAPTVAEAQRLFTALADGGSAVAPLAATFFSPAFGMVKDRFGVEWMLTVPQDPIG